MQGHSGTFFDTSPHWGMSGFYLKVIETGPVRPGDIIAVVAQIA
jgi:MOSC domain-containing protein YiiM